MSYSVIRLKLKCKVPSTVLVTWEVIMCYLLLFPSLLLFPLIGRLKPGNLGWTSCSTSCSWRHFWLRIGLPSPSEIKPHVSRIPFGSDHPGASTQKSAWPTVGYALRSGFSPSFCSVAHCVLVGVNPVTQRHMVCGLQQPSVFWEHRCDQRGFHTKR